MDSASGFKLDSTIVDTPDLDVTPSSSSATTDQLRPGCVLCDNQMSGPWNIPAQKVITCCNDCNGILCPSCTRQHQNIESLKKHRVHKVIIKV